MSASPYPRADLIKAVARAVCRVQLNGGDPEQPAVRWNGVEAEPQSFPAWHDFRDEAEAALVALLAALPTAGLILTKEEDTPTRQDDGGGE